MPASTRGAMRLRSGSDIVTSPAARIVLAIMRIVVGFFFLWAFLDKAFGLGFSTPRQMAWINGGLPAQGFIKGVAANSPFESVVELVANPVGDWLFMAGMLGVGVALTLGIGLKVSAIAASALMVSMYLALWPIGTGGTDNAATNPLVDLHSPLGSGSVHHPVRADAGRRHPGAGHMVVTPGRRLLAALMSPTRQTDERARAKYRVRKGACSTY